MTTDKLTLQLKKEFPEIFEDEVICLQLLANSLDLYEEYDSMFIRNVLIEKTGNIYGKQARVIQLYCQFLNR